MTQVLFSSGVHRTLFSQSGTESICRWNHIPYEEASSSCSSHELSAGKVSSQEVLHQLWKESDDSCRFKIYPPLCCSELSSFRSLSHPLSLQPSFLWWSCHLWSWACRAIYLSQVLRRSHWPHSFLLFCFFLKNILFLKMWGKWASSLSRIVP